MAEEICPVCHSPTAKVHVDPRLAERRVDCPICGKFLINEEAAEDLDYLTGHRAHIHLLSCATRQASEEGEPIHLTSENIPRLIASAKPVQNPFEAIDRLVAYVQQRMSTPADVISIDVQRDYPVLCAKDGQELGYYLGLARELNYIELTGGSQFRLALAGWERLDELRRSCVISRQAFVAMWFAPEMQTAWEHGFRPALTNAGYDPVRIDAVQHNEKIDDRIIAEIRRSGLLVADFTGSRGGVYFEAGFAMGLNIPVIWTVRESDVSALHFDTRQYNHVVWANPGELLERLGLRIAATIPQRPSHGRQPRH
jgi:nucleoside 2-deoxyribosyltransferase